MVFADLSGFTAMSERLDPEEVREVLAACFVELVDVIESHQGTVEKYIGDCIVAIFGAPLAQEDHAVKALKTSLGLLKRLEEFNGERELDLGLHIGVNSGLVVAGEIRAGSTRQYAVTGDTVNLAARLEGKSSTGEILVGPETYRLTQHLFQFGPPVPLSLKGKAQPVPARLLVGESEAPQEALTPIFGRSREMSELLEEALKPGLVEVSGPSGIGKTFVANHLAQELADAVVVSANPGETGEPFELFHQILDRMLPEGSSVSGIRDLIDARNLEVEPEHLAPLLGKPIPGHPDAAGAQTLTRIAVTRLFMGMPETAHVTIMVDDGQWADPSSMELLAHLSEQDLCRGLVFCRSESRRDEASLFKVFPLGPLDPDGIEEYLSWLLPEEKRKTVEDLARRSGGHPLFARELARQVTERTDFRALPGSLQAAVMARVDALAPAVKEVLEVASVLGPEFLEGELQGLCSDHRPAIDSGFLGRVEGGKLGFRHKLAQEAIYESLSLRRRRKLQYTVAEFLSERGAGDNRLAFHYSAAEEWEKAAYHIQRVAEHAVSLAADRETLESFQRTLEIRQKASRTGVADEFELLQTERQLGEVKLRQGDLAGATEHLRKAADMLGFAVPVGRWAVRLRLLRSVAGWLSGRGGGDYPESHRAQRELFRILKSLCFAEVSQPENFLLYSLEHLKVARACGDYDGIAVAQAGFGMAFDFAGAPRLAGLWHRKALKSSRRSLENLTHALVNLGAGVHYSLVGKCSDARAHLLEAVTRAKQFGDLKTWSTALVELAMLDTLSGALDSAEKVGLELAEIGRTTGDRQCRAWGDLALGRIALLEEDWPRAEQYLSRSQVTLKEAEDCFSLMLTYSHLVILHLRMGNPELAEEVLKAGEAEALEQNIRGHLVGWLALARAEFELQRGGPALKASQVALRKTRHTMGGVSNALRIRANCLWAAGDHAKARQVWEQAKTVAFQRGEMMVAAQVQLDRFRFSGEGPSFANLRESFSVLRAHKKIT